VLTRTFEYGRTGGHWTINGLRYDPNRMDAYPVLGTTEKWILRNLDSSPHIIHVHDVDQQLVSRNGNPPPPYELMKESWNISGGQTIEVLVKFTGYLGKYVFHCHLVEHEDDGMMMQLEVVATAITPSPTPTGPTTTPTRTLTPTRTPTAVCTPVTAGVTIGDNFFSPQNSTVYVGTTVHWTNTGRRQHSTTSTTGAWDSGLLSEGQAFDFTFNSVGTFPYFCTEHGGMTGNITVTAGCAPTSTPTIGPTFTRTSTPTITPTFTRTYTPTGTATATTTATTIATPTTVGRIVAHVTWQGISQPDSRNAGMTATLTLCVDGAGQVYSITTDANGTFTVTTGLPDGTYNWLVKGPMNLANSGTLNLLESLADVEMGLLRAGDSNNDNIVGSTDFSMLRAAFGKQLGDPGYDGRADFNRDDTIGSIDFNMLRGNFGQGGATLLCP
jgi:plastocyanin